jgi:beta-glucosidase
MLGMFDPEGKVAYSKIPMSVVGSQEHLKLSQEAAEKSLVILKNSGILPLKNVKKIALIGPNANNPTILIGNYNGDPINPISPLKGLQERLGIQNVIYTPGCPIVPGVYTDFRIVNEKNFFHSEAGKLIKGLKAEYFEDKDLVGTPKIVLIFFGKNRLLINWLMNHSGFGGQVFWFPKNRAIICSPGTFSLK